jgi:hypothetical protein
VFTTKTPEFKIYITILLLLISPQIKGTAQTGIPKRSGEDSMWTKQREEKGARRNLNNELQI